MYKTDLYHHENLVLNGKRLVREAVRALIWRGNQILCIYSPVNGDYKFPGGGIEAGEDHQSALRREVLEECGYSLSEVGEKIGLITEYSKPMEDKIDFFQMDSHYYSCHLSEQGQVEQNLDDYEKDLKMRPIWITPQEALDVNLKVVKKSDPPPKWTRREILFLEYVISLEV